MTVSKECPENTGVVVPESAITYRESFDPTKTLEWLDYARRYPDCYSPDEIARVEDMLRRGGYLTSEDRSKLNL